MKYSKLKQWVKSCLRKNRYETRDFALKVAKDIKGERGTELRVYYCEECSGFHLTSQVNINET